MKRKKAFNYKSIKSFEDACKHLGIEPVLPEVSLLPEELQKPVIENYKLLIIYKAINNGWIPDWTNSNQYKYYPWFSMSSGSGLSVYSYVSRYSNSDVGSRLCTDSVEKAIYIAKTFNQEYADCFIIK